MDTLSEMVVDEKQYGLDTRRPYLNSLDLRGGIHTIVDQRPSLAELNFGNHFSVIRTERLYLQTLVSKLETIIL